VVATSSGLTALWRRLLVTDTGTGSSAWEQPFVVRLEVISVAGAQGCIVASLVLATALRLPTDTGTRFSGWQEPRPVGLEVVGVAGSDWRIVASFALTTGVVVVLSADAAALGRSPVERVVVTVKVIITLVAWRVTARLANSAHFRSSHAESRTGALNVGRSSAAD